MNAFIFFVGGCKRMGLREQKKQKAQDSILQNAGNLFLTKGYAGTTLEEIAARAEIGVGTLYNYYDSKAEVFLAIMADKMDFSVEEIDRLLGDAETDVVDLILKFIREAAKPFLLISNEIWQELISVALGVTKPENVLLQKLIQVDNQFMSQLEKCFDYLINQGAIASNYPAKQVAGVIYSIILSQFLFYIYDKGMTGEQFISSSEEQITFVLQYTIKGVKQ
jgi:AcrR family transcriptional regulator